MKVRAMVDAPMYEERIDNYRNKIVKSVKEPCKKNHLLSIRISGMDREYSRELFKYIMKELSFYHEAETLLQLSACVWGRPEAYDEKTKIFIDSICVPKDFDDLANQKKLLVHQVRHIVHEMSRNKVIVAPMRV